jgi:hypothetical protein
MPFDRKLGIVLNIVAVAILYAAQNYFEPEYYLLAGKNALSMLVVNFAYYLFILADYYYANKDNIQQQKNAWAWKYYQRQQAKKDDDEYYEDEPHALEY